MTSHSAISALLITFYGFLVLVGGCIGHFKGKSTISLVMGLVFGLLLFLTAWGVYKKKSWGMQGSFLLTFTLVAFFAYRYLVVSHKLWPPGIMALFSAGVLIVLYWLRPSKVEPSHF